jgi:uncharacterized coiled-coil protein SlyX
MTSEEAAMPQPVTLEDLDRRVTSLERAMSATNETMNWMVTKLRQVQAVQEEHTLRLERIEVRMERLESKIDGFVTSLPTLIGDAVRGEAKAS